MALHQLLVLVYVLTKRCHNYFQLFSSEDEVWGGVKWRIMGMGGDVRGKKGTRVDTSCSCYCSCHHLL